MTTRRAPSGLIDWRSVESVLAWLLKGNGSHAEQLRGIARLRPERAGVIAQALALGRAEAKAMRDKAQR